MSYSVLYFILSIIFVSISTVTCYNGDPNSGLVLLSEKKGERSGVLSADHRCQDYPKNFPVSRISNHGTVHCTLWTENKCQGSLYIVPAHYEMASPQGITFKSVIC